VTLPLDATAALVAGRVRAARPTPPTGARRAGTKPEQRAGWVLDIQIGACAWAHGYALTTHNRQDFDVIRDVIVALYPTAPPLDVLDGLEV
jgi:predicted nucleic acid-binding protein